jgi:MFS family permease
MWYRSDEQPLRMVTYYCMNGFAGIFGGLLGYAIGHITTGLPPWQYVFLIFGSISLAWAAVFLIFMPDLPTAARFLSPQQRVIAVERVAQNRQGVKNHHFKKYQMWQCFRDPKTWILFVMSVAAQVRASRNSIILVTYGGCY